MKIKLDEMTEQEKDQELKFLALDIKFINDNRSSEMCCGYCGGSGSVGDEFCPDCGGRGRY